MKIIIETIPHEQQRYPTPGDWFYEPDGTLRIKVSNLENDRYVQLITIHELVEVLLCKQAGVTQESIDKFDMDYEKNRKQGDKSEPGDDQKAPYARQHCLATSVERMMAAEMGVAWNDYADAVEALP